MIEKVLKAIAKFLPRMVIVRRNYEENLIQEGWHTRRFGATHSTIILMGKDKEENEKKRRNTSKKLISKCISDVKRDIEDAEKDMEETD